MDNQLAANNPPATRLTLERLVREGIPRDQARPDIATAILMTANNILRDRRPFDEQAFATMVDRLPQLD